MSVCVCVCVCVLCIALQLLVCSQDPHVVLAEDLGMRLSA